MRSFTARITFQDRHQPAVNVPAPDQASAENALLRLLGQFASVRAGFITEPDGRRQCYLPIAGPAWQFLFTIPTPSHA